MWQQEWKDSERKLHHDPMYADRGQADEECLYDTLIRDPFEDMTTDVWAGKRVMQYKYPVDYKNSGAVCPLRSFEGKIL